MSRKGQSISINTIIVAAIALAVLVVLFAIFTGRLGIFSKALDTCANLGGSCEISCDASRQREYTVGKTDCSERQEKCCIPIPGVEQT